MLFSLPYIDPGKKEITSSFQNFEVTIESYRFIVIIRKSNRDSYGSQLIEFTTQPQEEEFVLKREQENALPKKYHDPVLFLDFYTNQMTYIFFGDKKIKIKHENIWNKRYVFDEQNEVIFTTYDQLHNFVDITRFDGVEKLIAEEPKTEICVIKDGTITHIRGLCSYYVKVSDLKKRF
ncbi:MAG: hypothetical protein WC011_02140 [Candidatus Paceibacterota bacterium]